MIYTMQKMKMKNNLLRFFLIASLLVNSTSFLFAQTQLVPIAEMKIQGLIGGVQNGKWIKPELVAPKLKEETEFVLVGWNGIEEGGVSWGKKSAMEDVCQEFTHMEFDLKMDSGVALGSGAKWNPVPRIPKKIGTTDAAYVKIAAAFLKTKRIAKPTVKITQAFRVDLEGDGKDEVLLTATYYKEGFTASANKDDYSFVLLRRIVGKKVQNIMLAGDFITKNIDFGAPNQYMVSSIADLNGDGKMEIVVHGEYYEGAWVEMYEMKAGKPTKVLETGCGV